MTVLASWFYHPIRGINFVTLYFRFLYDLLHLESFLLMNELQYCADLQISQVHQQIFLYNYQRNTLKNFLNSSIKSFSITQDFSSFSVE